MKKEMKKMTIKTLLLSVLVAGTLHANAQQDSPSGAPIITIFGDAGVGFSDGKMDALGFNLERAYLGYQYKLNGNWKTKVVYDMGKGDDAALQRLGYVKNAEIDYSNGRWGLNVGLTSTAQFNVQEKFWGHRYVFKSMMDQCKWGSSADLGLLTSYKAADWLSLDLSIFNGEGYKKIQSDRQLLYGLGMTFKPVEGLTVRVYGDMRTAEDTVGQYNMALFAGYRNEQFRLGVEYNRQFNHGNVEGRDLQAVSLYGAYKLGQHAEAYARYDMGSSSADDIWSYSQDGQVVILGLHYKVNTLLSISPNVRLSQAKGSDAMGLMAAISAKINL